MAVPDLHRWSTRVLRGEAAVAPFEGQWRALLERSGAHPVFNAPEWLFAQRRAYDRPDERLEVLAIFDDDQLVGWLPLVREAGRALAWLSRARSWGDGSFDSDYLEPLIDPRDRSTIAGLLARALARSTLADYAILRTMPKEQPAVAALLAALADQPWTLRTEERLASRADLAPDFEGYLKALKPRMRSKVRQALRRASEAGWRLESLERGAELGPWLADLERLHQARWIAAGEPGAFSDPRRRALYRTAFTEFHQRGQARIDRLVGPEGVLAIQAGFDAGGAYHQLQEGYAPELAAQRPGVALRALAIEAAIQRGLGVYDFLGGFSDHKADWGARAVPLLSLTVPLRSWSGRLLVWALERRRRRALATGGATDAPDGASFAWRTGR